MADPICPRCKSRSVVPSLDSAGHNECKACGLVNPVVAFHPEGSFVERIETFTRRANKRTDAIAVEVANTIRKSLADPPRLRREADPPQDGEPNDDRIPRRQWWQDID